MRGDSAEMKDDVELLTADTGEGLLSERSASNLKVGMATVCKSVGSGDYSTVRAIKNIINLMEN
jgi:hypothetical protein